MGHVLDGPLVLVVDDDRDTRDLYRVVLETASYHVEEAATLAEAVHMAASRHPDVVLSDWLLPDGDGLALSEKLRALPTAHDTPLLAITGVCMTGDELTAARAAGYSRVLEKPVTPNAIVDGVREVLDPAAVRSAGCDSD
jgi:CheY-like chemotaxis protein